VQVHVTTPANTRVSVDNQRARKGTFDTQVAVTTGQSFTIAVDGPSRRDATYYVRCLPTDFPSWSSQRNGTPQAAFYVTAPTLGGNGSDYVAVFDTNGVPVWWYRSGPQPINATFLPDGNLAWDHFPGDAPRAFELHRLDGSLVRTVAAVGSRPNRTDFHEFQQAPGGNYAVAQEELRNKDTTPCGGSSSQTVVDHILEIVRPDGSLAQSWDSAAHIPISEVDPLWYDQCRTGDAYHFNAIDPLPNNQLLVSYRHLNAIYKVDLNTGSIVWKLGGVPTAKSLTIVGDPNNGFSGQHDVRSLGDGTITLHDNETRRSFQPRAIRYRIDEAAKTATLVEQNTNASETSSFCCGSARKLPGGNWVEGWGGLSDVTEQTADGTEVFRLTFGNGRFSYRTQPVLGSALSAAALRSGMDAQHPR
jgi:hypothetical protein